MRIASYNILSGGYKTYTGSEKEPARLPALQSALQKINADFIGLIDTYRWDKEYSEKDIQKLFNYRYSFHISLEDPRLDPQTGMAILSNIPILKTETLRLENRNCIRADIDIDGNTLSVFTVYFDHAQEAVRMNQAKALKKLLPQGKTVIMGDLNALHPKDASYVKYNPKLAWHFLKKNWRILFQKDFWNNYFPAFREITKGEVIAHLESYGLVDASQKGERKATAFTKLGDIKHGAHFVIDHIYTTPDVEVTHFQVFRGKIFDEASDHYPIEVEIGI